MKKKETDTFLKNRIIIKYINWQHILLNKAIGTLLMKVLYGTVLSYHLRTSLTISTVIVPITQLSVRNTITIKTIELILQTS